MFRYLFLLIFFILNVPTASADLKVGLVDYNKISNTSKSIKSANTQINQKVLDAERDAKKAGVEFENRYNDLESKKSVLDSKEYKKKNDALVREVEEKKKLFYDKRNRMDKIAKNFFLFINTEMMSIIKVIADKEDLSVVFDKSIVLYSKKYLDITDSVVKELDKKIGEVDIEKFNDK